MTQPPTGGPYTGTFALTASGGPVTFTVSLPTGPNGQAYFTASPASGKLASGQRVTVVLTAVGDGPPTYVNTVTVNPGGIAITVYYPPSG